MVDWIVKFELFVPVIAMLARFNTAEPTLFSVIVSGLLVVLEVTAPHV